MYKLVVYIYTSAAWSSCSSTGFCVSGYVEPCWFFLVHFSSLFRQRDRTRPDSYQQLRAVYYTHIHTRALADVVAATVTTAVQMARNGGGIHCTPAPLILPNLLGPNVFFYYSVRYTFKTTVIIIIVRFYNVREINAFFFY